MAEVANTCPLEPTASTTMEATTTAKSENHNKFESIKATIVTGLTTTAMTTTTTTPPPPPPPIIINTIII